MNEFNLRQLLSKDLMINVPTRATSTTTSPPPHKCNLCNSTFLDQVQLNAHLSRHAGTHFRCAECNRGYQRKCDLTKHFNKSHHCESIEQMKALVEEASGQKLNPSESSLGQPESRYIPSRSSLIPSGQNLGQADSRPNPSGSSLIATGQNGPKSESNPMPLDLTTCSKEPSPPIIQSLALNPSTQMLNLAKILDEPPNQFATSSLTRNFQCDACGRKFKWKKSLIRHLANVHGGQGGQSSAPKPKVKRSTSANNKNPTVVGQTRNRSIGQSKSSSNSMTLNQWLNQDQYSTESNNNPLNPSIQRSNFPPPPPPQPQPSQPLISMNHSNVYLSTGHTFPIYQQQQQQPSSMMDSTEPNPRSYQRNPPYHYQEPSPPLPPPPPPQMVNHQHYQQQQQQEHYYEQNQCCTYHCSMQYMDYPSNHASTPPPPYPYQSSNPSPTLPPQANQFEVQEDPNQWNQYYDQSDY